MSDHGDGLRAALEAAEDRACLLERDLADLRTRADGWLELIHAAIAHHIHAHPTCDSWESR